MKRWTTRLLPLALAALLASGCASSYQGESSAAAEPGSALRSTMDAAPSSAMSAADSGGAYDDYSYDDYDEYEYEALEEAAADGEAALDPELLTAGGESGGQPAVSSRKIIYTVNINLQTLEFDATIADLESGVAAVGGFVEASYVEGLEMYEDYGSRYARYTLRVPSNQLDSYIGTLDAKYNITSKERSTEDITSQYYDVDARLTSLRTQEERLLAMLENAADVEYLIRVEEQLSYVRYQIESLTTSLRRMDEQVSYSTIHLYIQEVFEYKPVETTPITFSQRLSRTMSDAWAGFGSFWQELALGIVSAIPFLITMAILAAIVIPIVRVQMKKRAARPKPPIAPPPASFSAPPPPNMPVSSHEPKPDSEPDPGEKSE